jgi:Fungal Zn(2)-Cys(6) binuclear cluster domain
MCRKKKIKCDGKLPKCSHCINYKTECVFTPVEKKRNPPKGYEIWNNCPLDPRSVLNFSSGRAKYIEGLENRLGRMESLLRLSGLLSEEDAGKTDLGTLEKRLADRSLSAGSSLRSQGGLGSVCAANQSRYSTPRVESVSSPRTPAESPESPKLSEPEAEALSDMMCSLVTNNCGETRYIGRELSPSRRSVI